MTLDSFINKLYSLCSCVKKKNELGFVMNRTLKNPEDTVVVSVCTQH